MIDIDTVERHISFITDRLAELSAEIEKCKRGEYSPLMSFDRFQEMFESATSDFGMKADLACLCGQLGVGPHRCNQRERIVEVYMGQRAKNAA